MTRPLVSVVIPAFNSGKFIANTLKSILKQTYSFIEIIVIDDGSTDDTANIIKKINSKKVRYFYQKNCGLSSTRNRALKLACGEYIAFIDHDDYWYPDKIAKQLNIFQEKKEVGLVYTDGYITDLKGKIYHRFFSLHKPYKGKVIKELIKMNVIPWSSVMIKKSLLKNIALFRKDLFIAEDYEFLLRASKVTVFDYIDKPLIKYRRHEGNLSQNESRTLEELIWVLENFDKSISADDIKSIISKRLAETYFRYILHSLSIGKLDLAKTHIGKLISRKPNPVYLLMFLLAILKGKLFSLIVIK